MNKTNKTLDSIIYAFSLGWWCDPILGIVYKPNGEAAKQYLNQNGYLSINLPRRNPVSPRSTWKMVSLHRVIAYCRWGMDAFAGHSVIQVRHLDGVRTNNCYDNLLLGTPLENASDMTKESTSERSRKRWQSMTKEQRSEWASKIRDGFNSNIKSISAGLKKRHETNPEISSARMNYAREIRYGRIDKNLVSFSDYSKATQAYTEGKANAAQNPTGNP